MLVAVAGGGEVRLRVVALEPREPLEHLGAEALEDGELHADVGTDVGWLEYVGDDAQAGPLVQRDGADAGVAPYARRAVRGRVAHERVEDRRAGAAAARPGRRRHPADAPRAGLALGPDQADRDEVVALEGAERDRAGRLVVGQVLDRQVRPQHGLAQRAGQGSRTAQLLELGRQILTSGLRRAQPAATATRPRRASDPASQGRANA